MQPDKFLEVYRTARASAILRTHDGEIARQAMEAAVRAGFQVIEFTLTVPNALELIREFSARAGLVVGAGTVLTVEQAHAAAEAGAVFLVSPIVDESVIDAARALHRVMMSGGSSPTELVRAHRAGARLQKLFPAPSAGPTWVKQVLGPLPFLHVVPTSGVTQDNAAQYLAAGAFAVGFVNTLFDPDDLAAGRFDRVEERARHLLDAVRGPAAGSST